MFRKAILTSAATMLLMISLAFGEKNKLTPEEEQARAQQAMQMMSPMFGKMMAGMLEAELEILAKPETADKLAAFTRNYYDALIKQGFNKDEALRIVVSSGFPAFPGMQK